jgi:hypothetical protein
LSPTGVAAARDDRRAEAFAGTITDLYLPKK